MTFRGKAQRTAMLLAVAIAFAACEDQIVSFKNPDGGPPTSGSSGTGGAGGVTLTSMVMGSTGSFTSVTGIAGSSASSFGGFGGGSMCAPGADSFQMEIDRFDGSMIGCGVMSAPQNWDLELKGTVVSSDGVNLEINECPPDQTCLPSEFTTIAYKATNLNVIIPTGYFVDVEVHVAFQPDGCVQQLQITNLPFFGNQPSPGGADATLWLGAADGTLETFDDAPFGVMYETTECMSPGFDVYSLYFWNLLNAMDMANVNQGHQRTFQVDIPGMPGAMWTAANLRSYQTGNVNVTTNYAYWIAPTQVQPGGGN